MRAASHKDLNKKIFLYSKNKIFFQNENKKELFHKKLIQKISTKLKKKAKEIRNK